MANLEKLKGTLVYVQMNKPVECFIKEKGFEWKASVVVDEDTADEWNEMYPKQSAAAVKTSEFESKFKIPPPHPNEKKQYIITLRKNTQLTKTHDVLDEDGKPVIGKDGKVEKRKEFTPLPDIYRPKVLWNSPEGRVDITTEKLVANGSLGTISVTSRDTMNGPIAQLRNILVTDLIEYVSAQKESGSEFDEDEPAPAPKKAAPAKKAAKPQVQEDDGDDPF
jgi:hypothetical protein